MSSNASNLSFSLTNYDIPKPQKEDIFGKDITLRMNLPDGGIINIQAKESNEVGYVKLLLASQCSISAGKIQLYFNEKLMIDPMSLCDYPGVQPPSVDIHVKFID